MKNPLMIAVASLALILGAATTRAAEPTDKAGKVDKVPTAQQSKMKQCNVDAKGKQGDERKGFMKQCLSKKA